MQLEPAALDRVFEPGAELAATALQLEQEGRVDPLDIDAAVLDKLDDPSFPAPIYASLVKVEGEEGFSLIWSRRSGD